MIPATVKRLVRAVAVLAIVLAAPASAEPAYVAYVDQVFPADAQFHVERGGRPLPKAGVNLAAGDGLFVDTPTAVVKVRYIATNSVVTVHRSSRLGPGHADLTVSDASTPGLTGIVLAWLEGELSGADQGRQDSTATRGIGSSQTCFNPTGLTDDPTEFSIPILSAPRSQIAAGERALYLSWRGGAAPYSVTLSDARTGAVIAAASGIHDACWTRLPSRPLVPGRYDLAVVDGNGDKDEEPSLFVVAAAPPMPQPLRDAQLTDEARTLYYASWLTAVDGGSWTLEAQQLVAAMDCHSAAVRDWLRRWGDAPGCQ